MLYSELTYNVLMGTLNPTHSLTVYNKFVKALYSLTVNVIPLIQAAVHRHVSPRVASIAS